MENSKPKVLGFMPIHYVGSYLKEALLSVVDHVDHMVIAYSKQPSQGHKTIIPLIDTLTQIEIYDVCVKVLGRKLIWEPADSYPSEAHHRNIRYKHVKDHQLILSIDADEVFVGVPQALEYAMVNNERHYGIDGYLNHFRSHEWVCTDGFRPIRIENVTRKNQFQNLNCVMKVHHFSLCQPRNLLEYKFSSFGHASEIRPNYLTEVFDRWTPGTNDIEWLHPVSLQIWQHATPYSKDLMPEYLKQHPNHNLKLIP